MAYLRKEISGSGAVRAVDLQILPDGVYIRIGGAVIARQRPGTAKGFIFLSLEDETGIANVIVNPNIYEQDSLVVTRSKFLMG